MWNYLETKNHYIITKPSLSSCIFHIDILSLCLCLNLITVWKILLSSEKLSFSQPILYSVPSPRSSFSYADVCVNIQICKVDILIFCNQFWDPFTVFAIILKLVCVFVGNGSDYRIILLQRTTFIISSNVNKKSDH